MRDILDILSTFLLVIIAFVLLIEAALFAACLIGG
jgi:hypothetical protein